MRLKFIGNRTPPFFVPDRMGNVEHNAPPEASIVVRDANGVPLFGRIIDGSKVHWECTMSDWVLTP